MKKPCAQPGCPHPAKHKHGSSKGRFCGPCKTMRKRAREDGRDPEKMGWAELDAAYWVRHGEALEDKCHVDIGRSRAAKSVKFMERNE